MIVRACFVSILLLIGSFVFFINTPIQAIHESFNITSGSSANQVIEQLAQQKIIRSKLYFKLLVTLQGYADNLQTGEYAINNNITPLQLLDNFVTGTIKQYKITIVEGSTFKQLLEHLYANKDLEHKTKKLSAQQILIALNSSYRHPEGLFFPDTYFFHRGMSDLDLLQLSYDKMQRVLQTAWDVKTTSSLGLKQPYQALILASIIEKETASNTEVNKVSGVYHNRLNKIMHLNADPTVLYGVYGDFDQKLTKKDLARPGKYNTYINYGLPPTPIALPGLAAITAALNPLHTEMLYFVAKKNGEHHFSTNLRDHTNAINEIYKTVVQEKK
ncbi:MAG: aminodeoxychorismate lyase [Thiotrichales bacterium]|nr:MAG: aminodeoxychorismate lyase [Thiotrichales bacterium]